MLAIDYILRTALALLVTFVVFRAIPRLAKGGLVRLAQKFSPRTKTWVGRIPLWLLFALLAGLLFLAWEEVTVDRLDAATETKMWLTEYLNEHGEHPPIEEYLERSRAYYQLRNRSVNLYYSVSVAILAALLIPTRWNLERTGSCISRAVKWLASIDSRLDTWSKGDGKSDEHGPRQAGT